MEENINRRNNLIELMDENSAAIIFSGVSKITSEDEFYPFVVNRHFYYLTNITQENSVLLIVKGIGETKTYLFIDEYNELKEKWTGKRLTDEEASELSSINNIQHTQNFETFYNLALTDINNQYGKINKLYLDFSPELKIGEETSVHDFNEKMMKEFPHLNIENVYPLITSLRMKKSEWEVEQLREAIKLTNMGIEHLLTKLKDGLYEYELASIFSHFGMMHGRHQLSFDTIVASGKSATVLHYPQQTRKINMEDMVLFDLGFESNLYCADISRTYPVNGIFSELERKIYQSVLNCNKAVIEYARVGLTLKDLQEFSMEFLKNECVRNGLLKPEDDIRRVYYHGISHHLGLDTHDVSERGKPLEVGNVITVEPGLYFKEYNIGVRIEDDILITPTKAEVLSKDIAKEIDEIERMMKNQ